MTKRIYILTAITFIFGTCGAELASAHQRFSEKTQQLIFSLSDQKIPFRVLEKQNRSRSEANHIILIGSQDMAAAEIGQILTKVPFVFVNPSLTAVDSNYSGAAFSGLSSFLIHGLVGTLTAEGLLFATDLQKNEKKLGRSIAYPFIVVMSGLIAYAYVKKTVDKNAVPVRAEELLKKVKAKYGQLHDVALVVKDAPHPFGHSPFGTTADDTLYQDLIYKHLLDEGYVDLGVK